MNGKVRKQLTKSVDGKQTQSSCEICDMFAERSVFSVFGLIQFRTQNGLINQVGWREYGTFMSIWTADWVKSVHVSLTENGKKEEKKKQRRAFLHWYLWLWITKQKPVQLVAQHHSQSSDVQFKVTKLKIIWIYSVCYNYVIKIKVSIWYFVHSRFHILDWLETIYFRWGCFSESTCECLGAVIVQCHLLFSFFCYA